MRRDRVRHAHRAGPDPYGECMSAEEPTIAPPRRRSLLPLGIALVIVIVLERIVSSAVQRGSVPSAPVQLLLSDLASWVPLVLGVLWYLRDRGATSVVDRLGLRISVFDVSPAIAIACLARAVDGFLNLAMFDSTGLSPQPVLGGGVQVAVLTLTVLGPCILSPVIEEAFFRGTLQPLLADRIGGEDDRRSNLRLATVLGVVGAAVLFAAMHVLVANTTVEGAFVTFVSTFVLGLLLGTFVAVTKRLGGAILAHVLFNAIAVALTWPR
ncbi:hypothetical protein DEI82_00665 [Curtobacterium sp. MCBD17_019]|nr:hypothetical protein DEI82_00665 [Curtobacterium sp. MCBD17_019]